MDHEREPCESVAPRRWVSSGDGRPIQKGGRAVCDLPMTLDFARGDGYGRPDNIEKRRRKRDDAHQPAALPIGRMRRPAGFRIIFRRHRLGSFAGLRGRMSMLVVVIVPMRRLCLAADVDHTSHMAFARQARRNQMRSRQCVGHRRCQHAQQIHQGDNPPCFQPLRSGQTNQHCDQSALGFDRFLIITANSTPANTELRFRTTHRSAPDASPPR